MKKIERLKLNQLSKDELKKRELKQLRGGNLCKCCCGYQGEPGGSNTAENANANHQEGHQQSYGDPNFCVCFDNLPVSEYGDFN